MTPSMAVDGIGDDGGVGGRAVCLGLDCDVVKILTNPRSFLKSVTRHPSSPPSLPFREKRPSQLTRTLYMLSSW